MSGIGTIDNPYDFITALTQTYIRAGDTIWLRGGTYAVTDLAMSLAGATGDPVIIKAYPGESPVVNGGLIPNGNYVRFQGVRFTNSGWTNRESVQTGDTPGDLEIFNALIANGDGLEFINCIMDNGRHGCAWYGQGGLMYGCLLNHNGWKNPSTPQGHGVYPQNNSPVKTIRHSIFGDNFGWGIHAYSSSVNKTNSIMLDGNISFCNGSPSGLTTPNFTVYNTADVERAITVKNNVTYQPNGENTQNAIGYSAATDVTFTDNYTPEHTETIGVANFLANSGNYDGPDIGNEIFVFPNEYDANRLHVAIYNQAEAASVSVPVDFDNGDTVKAYNVQNYFNDVQTLMVSGGVVSVAMTGRTVASPYGWDAPASSFPKFGAFVMVKQ